MITVEKLSKILGKRGKHQIGSLTSGERGKNVATVCCMSATGQHLPVAFIFPRKRMKPELMDNASSGSVAYC